MSNGFDCFIGIAGFAVGFIGIGYAIGKHLKLKAICEKLDKSVDELSDSIDVDISQAFIEKAVNEAVHKRTNVAVNRAISAIINDVEADMYRQIKHVIADERPLITKSIAQEVKGQIKSIDPDYLEKEIIRQVKEEAIEKVDDKLDDVVEDFNDKLENISKIYSSIAKAIHSNNDSLTVKFFN